MNYIQIIKRAMLRYHASKYLIPEATAGKSMSFKISKRYTSYLNSTSPYLSEDTVSEHLPIKIEVHIQSHGNYTQLIS